MLPLLVVCLIIKHTLGAPMALIGFATSHLVAAFRHTRLLSLWGSVLFTLLGWSLAFSYAGDPFFQPGTRRPSTRPLQTRQIILSCCCPDDTTTEDEANDVLLRELASARALSERLTARHGLYLLSQKELTLNVRMTGRRLRLSDAYDAYCMRCPVSLASFPDDPGITLITLIHGSVRVPPRENL